MKKSSLKPYRIVFLMLMISSIIAAGAGSDTDNLSVIMTMGTIVPSASTIQMITGTPAPYVYINFKTEPSGATLWIDNKEYGTTPQTARFPDPGTHTYRITLPGYQDATGQFTVPGPTENFVTLSPVVTVTSIPTTVPISLKPTSPLDPAVLLAGLCIAGMIIAGRKST